MGRLTRAMQAVRRCARCSVGPVPDCKRTCGDLRWLRPGLVTFFAPLGVLAVMIGMQLRLRPQYFFNTVTLKFIDASGDEFGRFARDLDGRMTFAILSVAIWIAAVVAVFLAGIVLSRTWGRRTACLFLVMGVVVGLVIAVIFSWSSVIDCREAALRGPEITVRFFHGFREIVVDNVLCAVELHHPEAPVLRSTEHIITFNSLLGFAGATAVMAAMGGLAMSDKAADVMRLRRRLDDFRTLTLMGSILFVLNALVTKTLTTWAQSMIAATDDATNFQHLANALLNGWAAQASTVLFATIGLCALFIYWQIEAAAAAAKNREADGIAGITAAVLEAMPAEYRLSQSARQQVQDDFDETEWKKNSGLTFETTTVVTAVIGTIAPFLAGPATDLVTKALH